jgi:hypothetical protein
LSVFLVKGGGTPETRQGSGLQKKLSGLLLLYVKEIIIIIIRNSGYLPETLSVNHPYLENQPGIFAKIGYL